MTSFPASKYSRYKRATAFFLEWLLRARGRGRHAGKRVALEAFNDVVNDIAASLSTLTPKLLQDLPKALGACQCAITLRERVALFFDDDEYGHQHFLGLLRSWLDTLKGLQVDQQQETRVLSEIKKFENYYEVLQVDEDYFPDEEAFVNDTGASKKSKAERKRLFDEAFAQDLQLEVVCYFMELEELVEGVFNVYDQVKKQEKTMMEATVVGTLALSMANALIVKLQLRYPVLKLAEDLIGVLVCYPSTSLASQVAEAVAESRRGIEEEGTCRFVQGKLLHDFTNVWNTLSIFAEVFPPLEQHMLIGSPDGFFVPTTLPMLYNMILMKRLAMGRGLDGQSGLVVDFMNSMELYFETREVTIQLVFLCICWMQSVAALQGDAGLGRNISLTIKHTEDLINIMEATLPKHPHPSPAMRDSFHAIMKDMVNGFEASLRTNNLARANPLFAGSQMMSNHLEYLLVGSGHFSSMCRAFCHLYNAFVKQGLLDHIPFFDDMLDIYSEMIFGLSSRTAAVHGSYNRVYLLAANFTGRSIDGWYDDSLTVRKHTRERKNADPNMLSLTYRLLHGDLSFLKGASSTAMLKKAADVCTKELFETRTLSRDLMTLTDDLKDLFSDICAVLGRQGICDEYIAELPAKIPLEFRVNRALRYTVMVPLLALVDALQPNGSLDWNLVPAKSRNSLEIHRGGEFVRESCRRVAVLIKTRFGMPSNICEEKYFTFPSGPDIVNREYGSVSFKVKAKNDSHDQVFCDLMELLKTSTRPVSGRKLAYFKSKIKNDSALLGMCTRNSGLIDYERYGDLCTILHQAAAGPAPDAKLVEWLIQMGALYTQPLHCRKEPRQRDLKCPWELLPNTMAMHSAAIAGYETIVKLILEADNLVDMNTATFHTKETLAHLVVKRGYQSLYYCLQSCGADFRIKDGTGQNLWEMTTDREWSSDIAQTVARIEESSRRGRGRRENPGVFQHYMSHHTERIRQSVFSQRDEERRCTMSNDHVNTGVELKKKMTGKKAAEGKAQGGVKSDLNSFPRVVTEPNTSTTPNLLAALLGAPDAAVTNTKNSSKASGRDAALQESIEKTANAFVRLRDPATPVESKTADVQRVCKVIQRLDESIEVQANPNKMIGTGVQLRIDMSLEATQAIHMMQKFHRIDHASKMDPVLAAVRELCATMLDFVKFVVRTAWISTSVDRMSQANEVMDVLEKRLIKTPFAEREPPQFRELVQMYAKERDAMGLGRSSSPGTFRRLEWYLNNTVVNSKLQMILDKMTGRPFYFYLTISLEATDREFSIFKNAIDAIPRMTGVACFRRNGWCVVYGGTSKDDVAKVCELVRKVAKREEIQIDEQNSQLCTSSVRVGEFEFSASGVFRKADATCRSVRQLSCQRARRIATRPSNENLVFSLIYAVERWQIGLYFFTHPRF